MASIYDLKPRFQAFLRPILHRLREMGVTPNALTLAALALSISTGAVFWLAVRARVLLLLVPVALFVRMALNALDGMMAREYAMQSKLGQVLNELGDVLSDIAVFLPLAAHARVAWPVWTFVLLSVVNEFAGVLGVSVCGARLYDGPMGKSDRAFAVGLAALLLWLWRGFAGLLTPYCLLLSLLLVKSTANRVLTALGRTGERL
jgi:CDP-diacylglycerol--glycerol-3-phosphate 3-phosphatidyltransferase